MNDFLYLGMLISFGLILGTYMKFSMYGIHGKINIVLTLITPFLVLNVIRKHFMKNIRKNPIKAFKNVGISLVRYPLMITIISEITLESMAESIAKSKVKNAIKKDAVKVKRFNTVDVMDVMKETIEKFKLSRSFKEVS